jgi:hypothetical protein
VGAAQVFKAERQFRPAGKVKILVVSPDGGKNEKWP